MNTPTPPNDPVTVPADWKTNLIAGGLLMMLLSPFFVCMGCPLPIPKGRSATEIHEEAYQMRREAEIDRAVHDYIRAGREQEIRRGY